MTLPGGLEMVALSEMIPLGFSLPHRSPERLEVSVVREVAQRAEHLGFRELWVTENTIDRASSLDALTLLSYTAAFTSTIRLGVSVVVLPVHSPVQIAHQVASLDVLSAGRAVLGVGFGRDASYVHFQVPLEHRVTRFRESIEVMKALWSEESVNFAGQIYSLEDASINLKPVQKPHPPIWFGGGHPQGLKRAARLADGWMGAGGSSKSGFANSVGILREALEQEGRDHTAFPISKRVFISVDDRAERARSELEHWFEAVYHRQSLTNDAGVWGTPTQVGEQLEEFVAWGANHLLLNPVTRYGEQLECLADLVGLGR